MMLKLLKREYMYHRDRGLIVLRTSFLCGAVHGLAALDLDPSFCNRVEGVCEVQHDGQDEVAERLAVHRRDERCRRPTVFLQEPLL